MPRPKASTSSNEPTATSRFSVDLPYDVRSVVFALIPRDLVVEGGTACTYCRGRGTLIAKAYGEIAGGLDVHVRCPKCVDGRVHGCSAMLARIERARVHAIHAEADQMANRIHRRTVVTVVSIEEPVLKICPEAPEIFVDLDRAGKACRKYNLEARKRARLSAASPEKGR